MPCYTEVEMRTGSSVELHTLAEAIKTEARAAGFDLCGITTAEPFDREGEALARWVAADYHGGMAYMARNAPKSPSPRAVEPQAQALVVVGLYYGDASALDEERPRSPRGATDGDGSPEAGASQRSCGDDGTPRGLVSRYARGADYHDAMAPRLRRVAEFLRSHGARIARYYVDTGPMIDRAAARRAGLGWYGKNTLIITRAGFGSWVFLGEILTDVPLPPDPPARGDCGRCRICLDACPTGAIVAPYTVDARRCISYLTIEHRGAIPLEMRPLIGDRIFGCDVCQAVCPHNAKTLAHTHPEFAPRTGVGARPGLIELLNISEEEFRRRFAGSPVTRTKRRGLRRNVAVALGNAGDRTAIPELVRALADDTEPLVRSHAAWALGRIGTEPARAALQARLDREPDTEVRGEIALAIAAIAR
jgi:epoxyqueuosine reductase